MIEEKKDSIRLILRDGEGMDRVQLFTDSLSFEPGLDDSAAVFEQACVDAGIEDGDEKDAIEERLKNSNAVSTVYTDRGNNIFVNLSLSAVFERVATAKNCGSLHVDFTRESGVAACVDAIKTLQNNPGPNV